MAFSIGLPKPVFYAVAAVVAAAVVVLAVLSWRGAL